MQYKLCPIIRNNKKIKAVVCYNNDGSISSIPFDPANTDYQQFKTQVLAGAELQDADGNVMTQEQANEFINTLPQ